MSVFTVWGCLLLLFKCLGPKHLGVFSGHPYRRQGAKATTGRIIFLISSIIVMIFSILVVTKGLTQLDNTTDTIDATNQDVIKIHDEFVDISTSLKRVSLEATPVRDELVNFLKNDICPLSPGSATERDIRQVGSLALVALQDLSDFIEDELTTMNQALLQTRRATDDISKAVEDIQFTGGAATGVMIPYFIVPALLLVALLLGWFEVYSEGYYFFTTWFTMPFFVLMIIFSFLTCGFIVLATEGNADFCAGGTTSSPEGTIQRVLWEYNVTQGSFYYDAIMFYSNQCRPEGPWGFLEGYYADLVSYIYIYAC
jgi:hypothetical protein